MEPVYAGGLRSQTVSCFVAQAISFPWSSLIPLTILFTLKPIMSLTEIPLQIF
jgi:hypothetical protein